MTRLGVEPQSEECYHKDINVNMASLIRYCYLGDAHRNESDYVQFKLQALDPFDALKVVLEQRIYLDFVSFCGKSPSVEDFNYSVREMIGMLPIVHRTRNAAQEQMYAYGIDFLRKSLDSNIPLGALISLQELKSIFYEKTVGKYINGEYTCTMTEPVLELWWSMHGNAVHDDPTLSVGEEVLGVGVNDAPVLIPNLEVFLNRDTNVAKCDNRDRLMRIRFTSILNTRYEGKEKIDPVAKNALVHFLKQFDFHHCGWKPFISALASYCLDHSKYVMTNSRDIPNYISDICFDLVTGSDYISRSAGLNVTVLDDFVSTVKEMVDTEKLPPITDYSLFGELLKMCHADAKLVNYFIKPINLISASEALMFRESEYAELFADRLAPRSGMEALSDEESSEEDDPDNETDDAEAEASTDDDDSEASPEGEDPVPDDLGEDPMSPEGDAKSAVAKPKPLIDPNQMLLELAKGNETLSDYLYKELVARRINALLRNPPENARPNDLLMLKRWRSRWLFLVSVNCIRDFLTRTALRLSNN